MLKNLTQLELTIGDKVYQFTCAPDSPLEHIKEVLFQFQKYVGQIEDNIKAQKAQQASKTDIQPEIKEEVKPSE